MKSESSESCPEGAYSWIVVFLLVDLAFYCLLIAMLLVLYMAGVIPQSCVIAFLYTFGQKLTSLPIVSTLIVLLMGGLPVYMLLLLRRRNCISRAQILVSVCLMVAVYLVVISDAISRINR